MVHRQKRGFLLATKRIGLPLDNPIVYNNKANFYISVCIGKRQDGLRIGLSARPCSSMVEQALRKRQVVGSSPTVGSKHGGKLEMKVKTDFVAR